MHRPPAVSLADLAAVGVRLRPTEAVTIVRTLIVQVAEGTLPGVPSAHVIRLSPSGGVTVEGPVVASGRPVPRAAQLLAALLRGSQRTAVEPTPLRHVIARALDDPPKFVTLEELAGALAPFAAHDAQSAIVDLTSRQAEAAQAETAPPARPELAASAGAAAGQANVSEMRRLRRDTGLSLDEVSKRSRIPVSMLRQLEWGYLRNWPAGLYGRTQLVRYARAAGLPRQLVLDAIWPLAEAEAREGGIPPESLPAPPSELIEILQPTFQADEVLFEAEHPEARPVTASAPPSSELPAFAPAPSAPAHAAATVQATEPADELVIDPYPALTAPDSLEAEAPRRSSMVAAAAVLALAATGALWGMRSQPANDGRAPVSRVVRRLPAQGAPDGPVRAADRSAAARPPVSGLLRPPVVGAARPTLTTAVIQPASDARLIPVEASEDDTLSSSRAFASAGGAAFASPVQSDQSTDRADGGLGLRITRVVDDNSRNYHARPSPDGTRVAFDSDRDGERAVFVADANGRNLRRVSGDGFAAVPNWSPDGRTLSFVRAEESDPGVWNLWALDLESGESRRLTSNPTGRPLGASWFPDGQRIAYSRGTDIVVLDVSSGKPSAYPSPQPGHSAGAPAVSPDGRWAIFPVSGEGAWLLDLEDRSARKVLSDPTLGEFTWSPDGSRVAYYSRRDAEWAVWVMATR